MNESRKNLEDWLLALDSSSYYELLGVLEIADDASIQKAFHRFAAAFHPDRHRSEDAWTRECVSHIFKRGAEAYRVLREPTLRARYDLGLAQGKLRLDQDASQTRSHVQALPDLCQTPAGRLHARHAQKYLDGSQISAALAELERALAAEGTNPLLEERLIALRQFADIQ